MSLLLGGLWPALALSVLLGLGAGWLSGMPRDRAGVAAAAILTVTLLGLTALAVSQSVPGAYGLWVETASLMLACYLAGCVIGGCVRTLLSRAA